MIHNLKNIKIAIVGLGYVGLPLAVEFSKNNQITCFDIDKIRIKELKNYYDRTLEVPSPSLKNDNLIFTCNDKDLEASNFYIVTVPTPIDIYNNPDLTYLERASEIVGKYIKKGDIIVYESTVYPGVTEDVCVPILKQISGLEYKKDFHVGYSPERINPGDKQRTVDKIVKVVSGSSKKALDVIDSVYSSIITVGTYRASSIKTAEAAKVIENTQRDLNIALINELSIIFQKIGINTSDVLDAASTKWNFLNFKPGLVGGHCIGVDPYYLTFLAESLGYHPEIIAAGRRLNDSISKFWANFVLSHFIKNGINPYKKRVLVLGLTFKENCPDLRNTKVYDFISALNEFGIKVDTLDPYHSKSKLEQSKHYSNFNQVLKSPRRYSALICLVPHKEFKEISVLRFLKILYKKSLIVDFKSGLKKHPDIITL